MMARHQHPGDNGHHQRQDGEGKQHYEHPCALVAQIPEELEVGRNGLSGKEETRHVHASSADGNQGLPFLHRITLFHHDGLNSASRRGLNECVHLHCLQCDERVPRRNLLAQGAVNGYYFAG